MLPLFKTKLRTLDTRTVKPPAKTAAPVYNSPEWKEFIAGIIAERGRICEDVHCKTPGRRGMRVFGDHIIELKDGGALLDGRNVMLRCGACHTTKTLAERAKRSENSFAQR
jgi:5-methylcytosine-specific restriction protein A